MHAFLVKQWLVDDWHCPLTQLLVKHGSTGLSQLITFEHPKRGSHESFVHPLPSSQLTGVKTHDPPWHVSLVQALLSLHWES